MSNKTVYLSNINEKININALQSELRELCAQYGTIIDVAAKRSLRMRGQAFIAFDTVEDAAKAATALNGLEFHNKQLHAAMAKRDSDAVLPQDIAVQAKSERRRQNKNKRPSSLTDVESDPGSLRASKRPRLDPQLARKPVGEPNNILFLEGLPTSVEAATLQNTLQAAFTSYEGFVEARVFAARGLGFIEFNSVEEATTALNTPVSVEGHLAKVTFAKK